MSPIVLRFKYIFRKISKQRGDFLVLCLCSVFFSLLSGNGVCVLVVLSVSSLLLILTPTSHFPLHSFSFLPGCCLFLCIMWHAECLIGGTKLNWISRAPSTTKLPNPNPNLIFSFKNSTHELVHSVWCYVSTSPPQDSADCSGCRACFDKWKRGLRSSLTGPRWPANSTPQTGHRRVRQAAAEGASPARWDLSLCLAFLE